MKTIITLSIFVLLSSASAAFADDFRCPNGKIVSTGDSISIVSLKCDKPFSVVKRVEPMITGTYGPHNRSGVAYVEVEEWLYKEGSSLLHTLIFRNGILADVQSGGFR